MTTRRPSPKPSPKPKPFSPGTIFAVPLDDGRWTAYQLISSAARSAAILALDWLGDAPPALDELRAVPPLRPTHHSWKGRIQYTNVKPAQPPRIWAAVGVLPPLVSGASTSFGFWPSGVHQVALQRRWDTEIPAPFRDAYQAARDRTTRLAIGTAELPLTPGGAATWSALAALPCLTQLSVCGDDGTDRLLERLRALPLIQELRWSGLGRDRVDLSSTRLVTVSIEVGAPLTLIVPDSVQFLHLHGEPGALTVIDARHGERVELELSGYDGAGLPRGLSRLRGLRIARARAVDLAPIVRAYPALRQLHILGEAPVVTSLPTLAALTGLRRLTLRNCFQLDAAAFPAASTWPELDQVEIHGYRKDDGPQLRERLGMAPRFHLRGGKRGPKRADSRAD